MGKGGEGTLGTFVASGCTLVFTVLLSLAACLVMLIGLAGLQSVCVDYEDAAAFAMQEPAMASAAPERGAQPGGLPSSGNGTSQVQLNELSIPESISNVTELVKNLTQATKTTLNTFMSKLANTTSMTSCARVYSLHWWAWVCQMALVVAFTTMLCSGRCMLGGGQPLLLFTATVVVLDMIICNQLVSISSFADDEMSSWANVVLAGFILACISNYMYLLAAPSLMRAREWGRASAEERRPLRSSTGEGMPA